MSTLSICIIFILEFENELEEDIKNDTDGNFERFLVSLANGSRAEGYDVDDDMANEDAQRVFDVSALVT